jgi:hypothetical protein
LNTVMSKSFIDFEDQLKPFRWEQTTKRIFIILMYLFAAGLFCD